jgi:hypothetical protein
MSLFNKLLILLIILISFFILYHLFIQRQKILNGQIGKEGMTTVDKNQEKLEQNDIQREMSALEIKTPTTMSNVNKRVAKLPLNQVCIKGSYNSAYTGKYISIEMIRYVLSRGCRYLDFELYFLDDKENISSGKELYVGYSKDANATSPTTYNKVLFTTVLKNTLAAAFSMQSGKKYVTTNPNDPLFIQLRMKTENKNKENMLSVIAKDIERVSNIGYLRFIGNNLGTFAIDSHCSISSLLNKVVFVFEEDENISFPRNKSKDFSSSSSSSSSSAFSSKTTFEDSSSSLFPSSYPKIGSTTVFPFIYMLNNTKDFRIYYYKELLPKGRVKNAPKENTPYTTNVKELRVVLPTPNKGKEENPSIYKSIGDHGVQITAYQYYKPNYHLLINEKLFDTYKSSFVPMTQCLNYIKTYPEMQSDNPVKVLF